MIQTLKKILVKITIQEKHIDAEDHFWNLWQVWTEQNELVIGVIGPIWWDLNIRRPRAQLPQRLRIDSNTLLPPHPSNRYLHKSAPGTCKSQSKAEMQTRKIIAHRLLGLLLLCYQCPGPVQSFTGQFFLSWVWIVEASSGHWHWAEQSWGLAGRSSEQEEPVAAIGHRVMGWLVSSPGHACPHQQTLPGSFLGGG